MKCTNKIRSIGIIGMLSVLLCGCGAGNKTLVNAYDAYSYNNSFTNQNVSVSEDYYASDLCVTNTINFGTEDTYSEVAQGAGVFNITTKEVLYNQDIFKQLYPASTTKILTAYIIIRDCDLGETVTVSKLAATQSKDSSVVGLNEGDRVTVRDLLYGLMLLSGNDAAEALAEFHSGSVEAFAEEMTRTAHELGATNSQFRNPSGLPDKEHYTTVYDMYLIFQEALKQDTFVEIISSDKKNAVYTDKNGNSVEKTFTNHGRYKDGRVKTPEGFQIIGGKTGTTYDAGYCLVLYSKNPSGDDIISIVFKADGTHNLYLLMNQILSEFAN